MSPEYGATCAIFPVDEVTLQYLRFTGRSEERVALVEAYMKEQGLFHTASLARAGVHRHPVARSVERGAQHRGPAPTAGPDPALGRRARRSGKRCPACSRPAAPAPGKDGAKGPAQGPAAVGVWGEGSPQSPAAHAVMLEDAAEVLDHGSVVIAAITSCTNTSNPSVMLAAGLLAKKAVERGLERKPWVKTSLAPGSKVVSDYYDRAGLTPYLDQLGFNLVGYGCTTCIGNSGPLPMEISDAIQRRQLVACSVLSGNRNFEGRINSDVRANYLMSPPLVVAFALAGRIDIDLLHEPLGHDREGRAGLPPGHLAQLGRGGEDPDLGHPIRHVPAELRARSSPGTSGGTRWRCPSGDRFEWSAGSTYVRRPPYFEGMSKESPEAVAEIRGARVIALLGDSVTTDHISPAGSIKKDSPAGRYLTARGWRSRTSTPTAPAGAITRCWSAAPLPIPGSGTGWRRTPRGVSPPTSRPAR